MTDYTGSCHCGAVTFSFSTTFPITHGMHCNCSMCKRTGALHSPALKPEQLTIHSGQELLTTYLFADQVVRHSFCSQCGVYVFYTGKQCKVNLGCVEDIDMEKLAIIYFDGKNLL